MPKHAIQLSLASALEVVKADQEKVLELDRWAEIGDEGATQLATALRTNESLEVLILGSQNIGPAGAQVLSYACRCPAQFRIQTHAA